MADPRPTRFDPALIDYSADAPWRQGPASGNEARLRELVLDAYNPILPVLLRTRFFNFHWKAAKLVLNGKPPPVRLSGEAAAEMAASVAAMGPPQSRRRAKPQKSGVDGGGG